MLIPALEDPEPRFVLLFHSFFLSPPFASLPCSHPSRSKPNSKTQKRRVHSHASAALINFCEGVERDTLLPYLDPIVERLLKLLKGPEGAEGTVRTYVQEQVITTLAMVADASEITFAKVRVRFSESCLGSVDGGV